MTILSTLRRLPHILSIRKIASAACASVFKESELISILDDCLQDSPNIQALRKEQQLCLVNLASGKDVFAILPTGFRKSLISQLLPRLATSGCYEVKNVFDRGCLSIGLSDAGPSVAAKTAWILCGCNWTRRRNYTRKMGAARKGKCDGSVSVAARKCIF